MAVPLNTENLKPEKFCFSKVNPNKSNELIKNSTAYKSGNCKSCCKTMPIINGTISRMKGALFHIATVVACIPERYSH